MNPAFIRDTGLAKWLVRKSIREFTTRILRRHNRLKLPTGLPICLPKGNHFSSDVFVTNCDLDWGSERLLAECLDPDGVFLDVGAHIGYYALYMLPRVRAVYAFEPDPRSRGWLERNLAGYPNAFIIPAAVGAESGRHAYALASVPELSHLARPDSGEPDATTVMLDVVTIDEFTRREGLRVTGIKIDVEGSDLEVIAGGLETLRAQQPVVLTEAQPDDRLFALAAEAGCRVYAFVKDSRTCRTGFYQLQKGAPAYTKMLFLVPDRLLPKFRKLAP